MSVIQLLKLASARPNRLREEGVLKVAQIAFCELADLTKYLSKRDDYPDAAPAYTAEAKNAMGDLLTMLRLVCELESWSFADIIEVGQHKFLGRMNELKEVPTA